MLIENQIKNQIKIQGDKEKVWDALINPEMIQQYMFGTKTASEWKQGADIIFTGEYYGQTYVDKGIIKEFQLYKKLSYTYLSSFSKLPDEPENYSLITYEIVPSNPNIMKLSIEQKGFKDEESMNHSKELWKNVLVSIKELVENS